jgi:phosphodiesterase/alkaline phosphatase D-like protein
MNLRNTLFIFLVMQLFSANTQTISHGPVIGGVTENEFKIFIRSNDSFQVKVDLSTSNNFLNSISFTDSIDYQKDSSTTIVINGLQSNTIYYYKIFLDNIDVFNDQIKTFPSEGQVGNYVFGVGSCVSHNHPQEIINVVRMHNPSLFIYTGDWGYPDQLYGNSTNYFPSISGAIEKSYHDRYSDLFAKPMLSSIPIDYVYDDHDFVKDNCSGQSASSVYFNPNTQQTSINEYPYSATLKRKSVIGYGDYFPHYNLPDTSNGIYHSYKMGNAEFFVLDLRYSRTANTACFSQDLTGKWVFSPDSSHTILGSAQKQWLSNALLNSTADWKFVISPVTYNKSFSQIMNLMIALQDYNFNYNGNIIDGMFMAGVFCDGWAGFPNDREWLFNTCQNNNIDNVIILSGDTHSSAIDDGANSGFPEMMAANLAQENSKIAYYIDSIYINSLFNKGGQGINNYNFNYTFGKVEIFGSDSCKLSLIDNYNQLIANHTVLANALTSSNFPANYFDVTVFPNPSVDQITIQTSSSFDGLVEVFSSDGKLLKKVEVAFKKSYNLNVNELKNGIYILNLRDNKYPESFVTRYFIIFK